MKKTLTILTSALLIGTSVAAVRNSLSESAAIAKQDTGIEQSLASAAPTHPVTAKAPVMDENKFITTISFDFTQIPQECAYEDEAWEWNEDTQEDIYYTYYRLDSYVLQEDQYGQHMDLNSAKWTPEGLILDKDCSHLGMNTWIDDFGALNATFYCEYMNGVDAEHPLSIEHEDVNTVTYYDNYFVVDIPTASNKEIDNLSIWLTDSSQSLKITRVDYQISLVQVPTDHFALLEDGSLACFCLRTLESESLGIPRDDYACIHHIATEQESVTIPDSLEIQGKNYPVISVGITEFGYIEDDYIYEWGPEFKAYESPNLKSVIVPESVKFVRYNGGNCGFSELYLPGEGKTYLRVDNAIPMHVDNREAFLYYMDRMGSNWAPHFVRDYPIDWAVINVDRPGSWAQKYIELAGEDWFAFDWMKIVGEINETDLTHMQHLKNLERLDLSETTLTSLPYDFLPESRYSLNMVILPETLKTLENYAFNEYYNLTYINLENVETFGEAAVHRTSIPEANLSNAKYIGPYAFENCPINAINWPVDTKDLYLEHRSFANTNIKYLIIPEGLTEIHSECFADCYKLKYVTLPKSVKQIQYAAFYGCNQITDLKIPEGVTEIHDRVFAQCTGLEYITLPSTLTYIGNGAFENCSNLTTIECAAVMPPTAGRELASNINVFKATLYVLPFVKDLYHNATGWNNFMLVDDLMEQVDKLYVDRHLEIEIDAEYNDLLSNNPIVEIRSDGGNGGYINENSRVGELTISGNGTFSAGNFIFDSNFEQRENFNNWTYWSATMINEADNMRADAVTTNLHLYSNNGSNFWHFISFPYDAKISEMIPGENVQWVIRAYDATARANGDFDNTWKNLDNDYVLQAGKGYIIATTYPNVWYWDQTMRTITVPAVNNANKNKIFATGDVTVALEEIPAELIQNRSWNFIGNPYPAYYQVNTLKNFTAPVIVWRGSSYTAFSPVDDDLVLHPNEAFFVQCPTDQNTLTFAAEGRLHASELYEMHENLETGLHAPQYIPMDGRNVFNFNVQGANTNDRTRVVINPQAEMGYQMSCDAPKFFAETSTGIELYTTDSQTQYSINERPLGEGNVTMGIKAKQGEYTISVNGKFNSEYTVLLTDIVSGNVVDLTSEDYKFLVNEDFEGDRFVISFCTEVTGIDQITSMVGADENVTITAINGVTLYKGQLSGFRAPNAGIYIINAAANSYKAFLK